MDEDKGRDERVGAMLYWRPDVCSRVRDSGQRQHQHIDSSGGGGGSSGGRGWKGEAKATHDVITFKAKRKKNQKWGEIRQKTKRKNRH